jgi:pyruvate dehydrogenase E2 component (dihydrolipoamide acetyltransferase)
MAHDTATENVVDIWMPKLSDSMEEATVLSWLKRAGEEVRRGEPLVEVETDKATIVYEAESDGVLEEIVVDDGGTAALGAVIARLRTRGAAPAAPAPAAGTAPEPPAPEAPATAATRRPVRNGRARATPLARRLAGELGMPLDGLTGSGPGGRIVGADVRAARAATSAETPATDKGRGTVTERPHTATQRTIAARMTESRTAVPEFTLEAELSMEAAVRLRNDLRAGGVEPLPTFNDLVVRAVALTLRRFPDLNASYAPGKTLRYERINVGIAVATEDVLIVPTIRDADRKSIFEIAAEARRLANAARSRSLSPVDLSDGTFTVSNLGMFGVRRFDAVINPPQVAILAVGEVAERAVVEAGAIVARTMVDVALSCDHRVVYGAEAARFLQELRALLEHPALLIVDEARR